MAKSMLTVTGSARGFQVGDQVNMIHYSGSRGCWRQLWQFLAKPRVYIVTRVTRCHVEFETRRPTWQEWRREITRLVVRAAHDPLW